MSLDFVVEESLKDMDHIPSTMSAILSVIVAFNLDEQNCLNRPNGYASTWLSGYVAARLRSYVATRLHRLKNELDSGVACSFRLMDYCFSTLTRERVKFFFSALFFSVEKSA